MINGCLTLLAISVFLALLVFIGGATIGLVAFIAGMLYYLVETVCGWIRGKKQEPIPVGRKLCGGGETHE